MSQPILNIRWTRNPKNWTDLLPASWFSADGIRRGVEHDVVSPSHETWRARCDVRVSGRTAILDYGAYQQFNAENDMKLGEMQIDFISDSRQVVEGILWDGKPIGYAISGIFEDARELQNDLSEIRRQRVSKTQKGVLIQARLGQGKFREDVERRWSSACAVTGAQARSVLRASHIKPWRESSNEERLNPKNGILLAAHIDAALG